MENQAFVSIVPWTVIIQMANLLILAALLGKLLFRPVESILSRRRAEVEGIYSEAGRKRMEARELQRVYMEKIRNAELEAAEIKKRAGDEIEKMKTDVLDRAKGEASHIRESAKRQTERERKKAAERLRAEVSQLAVELAEMLIRREINMNDHRKLLDEFMENAEMKL